MRGGWAHSQFQHPLAFHHQRPVGGGHGLHPALLRRQRGLLEALSCCRREPGSQEYRDTEAACHGGARGVARLTEGREQGLGSSSQAGALPEVSEPNPPQRRARSHASHASRAAARSLLSARPARPRPATMATPPFPAAGGRLPRQPSAVCQGNDLLFLLTVWLKIPR